MKTVESPRILFWGFDFAGSKLPSGLCFGVRESDTTLENRNVAPEGRKKGDVC